MGSGTVRADRLAVWCDFGGVLTEPVSETLSAFCDEVLVPPEALIAAMRTVAHRYGTADLMEPLDTPMVDAESFAGQVRSELARTSGVDADLSGFAEKWFTRRSANDALVDCLRSLRESGHFVGMLSNMVPAFEGHWRRVVAGELFDSLVFSYQVGYRKPQPAIYALAEHRAGMPADRCVLVDDIAENCETARARGWRTVHFTSNDQAIPELDGLVGTATTG